MTEVSTSRPQFDKSVLVYDADQGFVVAQLGDDGRWTDDRERMTLREVTHWQELPVAPASGKG